MIFYPECKNQRIIINILIGNVECYHKLKSSILKQIINIKNVTALLDKDPGASSHYYLNNSKLFRKKYEYKNVELFIDDNKNKIILISPNLEEWIYKLLITEKINPENFGFSKNLDSFITETKINHTKFQQLIHQLRKVRNKDLERLEKFLKLKV